MSKTKQIEPEYEIPKVLPVVDDAFEELFKMDSEWSLEERFDNLLQAMTASAFLLIDRQRKTGKKIGEAEMDFQEQAFAQLKMIDKCWTIARKHGRVQKNAIGNNFEGELLGKIVGMKGTMSDIVTTVPVTKKEATNG